MNANAASQLGIRSRWLLFLLPVLIGLSQSGCVVISYKNVRTSHTSSLKAVQLDFGTMPDGRPVYLCTLSNQDGMVAKVSSYGAILTELRVPDESGRATNVVLGFDNLEQYLGGHPAFGATIGRYANRIARAQFTLNGKEYPLTPNAGRHHIHGGRRGFDKVLWEMRSMQVRDGKASVQLAYESPDGEEGYPGLMRVSVTYSLTADNVLQIQYEARSDKDTVINLTNHSYFNLAGHGDVLDHELLIPADRYTVADDDLIPTGELASVEGTPLDFRRATPIGARIDRLKPRPGGYDHNYVLNHGGGALGLAARVRDPNSGRVMEVFTTEPGMQLYTANHLNGALVGTGGWRYHAHAGFCLETQHFPDSVHHPHFPSVVLRPDQVFRGTTTFRFSTD